MSSIFIAIFFIAILGTVYALFNFIKVKKLEEGTEKMSEIALAIRVGADTFLINEYKVLAVVIVALCAIFSVFISTSSAVAFLIGVVMSGAAGLFGMKMATYANVRVANEARNTKDIGKTLKVALRGGSVMGLCVSSFALIGLLIVFKIYSYQISEMNTVANWC